MTLVAVHFLAFSLVAVAIFWALPRSLGEAAVVGVTLLAVALASPLAALWLLATTLATPLVLRVGQVTDRRGPVVVGWCVLLAFGLFASREVSAVLWIGGAYFTLRHIHVAIDWYLGRLAAPGLWQYARYQLFLPVLLAGPIHRYQHFEREVSRRHWHSSEFYVGAERLLLGAFTVIVTSFVYDKFALGYATFVPPEYPFLRSWAVSAIFWVYLYLSFEGLTSVALGLSRMMGLKLEENFDRPWAAAHLTDFWMRWHRTLTHWSRDYIFRPVNAATRQPWLAAIAALLFVGLWHDTTIYFVCWGLWQGLGVVITQVVRGLRPPSALEPLAPWVGRLSVPLWLSLTGPVVKLVAGVSP